MSQAAVEQWGVFEVVLQARVEGNPFTDAPVRARFRYGHREVVVDGFYDGEGTFRARFMPGVPGEWSYLSESPVPALDGQWGSFTCVPAASANHGPVRVRDTFHFEYADGTPYWQVGTTCYAWTHQPEALQEQTVATLRGAPFNKLRMCLFPKHYEYNTNEPERFPFERTGEGWDFTRFEVGYWRHLERRVAELRALGIEADLILFHPYDHWGFARMDAASDDRYLRYTVARLAAFRNVWWSLANEWDLMEAKKPSDWDRFFRVIQECDPYQHLRSIHQCARWYDHGKPWVTHASVQSSDLLRLSEWRETYRKPVVVDECCYEGSIEHGWGNLPAQELVRRFWLGTVGGGYVGHGETYWRPDEVLWWSKGGVLHGESPARLAFLRKLLEEGPATGFTPVRWRWDMWGAGKGDAYYLFYLDQRQPVAYTLAMPNDHPYQVDVIDPWEMTITPLPGTFSGTFRVPLPGKTGLAIRLRRA